MGQKPAEVIFRSHNDGDSVKISLPIGDVIDIEESPVVEFAQTFKIRVLESGESYAIDEYFFSFFSDGKDALEVMKSLIDNAPAQRISHDLLSPVAVGDGDVSPRAVSPGPRKSFDIGSSDVRGRSTPPLRGSVRASLMDMVRLPAVKDLLAQAENSFAPVRTWCVRA